MLNQWRQIWHFVAEPLQMHFHLLVLPLTSNKKQSSREQRRVQNNCKILPVCQATYEIPNAFRFNDFGLKCVRHKISYAL